MMQELSLNILDIAQNSVRAGATLTCITVAENTETDRMTIIIEDNGCGMTSEQIRHVIDPFFTTRTTRKVGLGVPFFKMAAELTGGGLNIDSKVGVGTVVTAKFGLSNIDRMPLGDMSATFCSLVQCNPNLDFCYVHRVNAKEMTADTRQFREVLQGVPLDTPEVIGFIGEYIKENTAELYK